ncbi:MAG: efflux RND transporter periplasmic adaptor subunit [Ekhidna sp.]|uniref:efflux RND transporter periplasmic adaptor subunit n=1 Tax=Ekhidna sp. TaxID=2608089 RepID=UPI0032EB51CE
MKYKMLVLISLIVTVSCSQKSGETSETLSTDSDQIILSPEQQSKLGIQFDVLKKVSIPQVISVRGIIDVPPMQRASINVFHGGYVQKMNLLPGQSVKKGTVLFTLQNPKFITMQQEYLEAKEQLGYLKADYERQKQLADEDISSEKKFRKAESDFKVVEARIEGLKEQLQLINVNMASLGEGRIVSEVPVYAPIAGFVTDLSINKGAYISPQDVAMKLINSEHMHLELKVFEKDVAKLREGQKIIFRVSESKEEYEGKVHLIEKSINQQDRTVQVHGHLPDGEGSFVVGMYVEAHIETGEIEVYGLPANAIIDMDGKYFVAVKSGEDQNGIHFDQVEVEVGKRSGELVEILNSEVLEGKEVVVKGAYEVVQ